jgi:ribosomal-protein-alanine N-acetyltransferase
MCREDIEQAIEIDSEAFPTMLPPTNYQRELKNELSYYIVACDDQQIVGKLDKERDSGDSNLVIGLAGFWLMAGEAHIVNIAVRQAYRRRGIGELLLISLISLALEKGADNITLEVRKSNAAAQKLYQKYGFNIKGVRRGYYLDDREDAVIMTAKDINSDAFQANLSRLKKSIAENGINTEYNY